MNEREAEALRFLEDLQANSPHEYEALVQQLNANAASKPGATAATPRDDAVQVTPSPGFVAKTRSATHQGRKVFVNVCSSDHVDKPAHDERAASNNDEFAVRVPMSLGPMREDLDKDGTVCAVYDAVFHSETVTHARDDAEFRAFVLSLIAHQVKQKHGDELGADFTYPRLRGNYKGMAPLPQMMRRRSAPTNTIEDSPTAVAANTADASPAAGGALVEEIGGLDEEEMARTLPTPSYSLEPRRWQLNTRGGEGELIDAVGDGGGVDGCAAKGEDALSVKFHVPLVASMDELELAHWEDELMLKAAGKYHAAVPLPRTVDMSRPPLLARFDARARILWLVLRCAAAAEELSADATAARAARESARRREALARRAAAADEAAEEATVNTSGDGSQPSLLVGNSEGEARPQTGDQCASEGAPGGSERVNEAAAPLLLPPLELSNSIATEIEE